MIQFTQPPYAAKGDSMHILEIAMIVFGAISLVTLILYGVDKFRAMSGAWRVPEWVLLICSVLGGGLGGALGMLIFNHKTRHWYFVVLNVIGVCLQIAAFVYLVVTTV